MVSAVERGVNRRLRSDARPIYDGIFDPTGGRALSENRDSPKIRLPAPCDSQAVPYLEPAACATPLSGWAFAASQASCCSSLFNSSALAQFASIFGTGSPTGLVR